MEKQLIFLHCFEFSLEDSKGLKSCISIHLFAGTAKYSGFTQKPQIWQYWKKGICVMPQSIILTAHKSQTSQGEPSAKIS